MHKTAIGVCGFLLCGAGLLAYLYEPLPPLPIGSPSMTTATTPQNANVPPKEPIGARLTGLSQPLNTTVFSNAAVFSAPPLVQNDSSMAIVPSPTPPPSEPAVPPAPPIVQSAASNQAPRVTKADPARRPEAIPAQPVEEILPSPRQPSETVAFAPVYSSGPVNGKRIALTFDDGPHPVCTYRILDELRTRNIKATFFVIGINVKRYPWVLQQIMAEGHEIGNHTYSHSILSHLSNEKIEEEISRCQEVIKNTIGYEISLFRPPYGAYRSNTREIAQQHHQKIILWSVDPRDWRVRDEEKVYQEVTSHVRGGSIILCHDGHPTTIRALPRILDTLTGEGYQFTTVSELCGLTSP